MKYFFATVLILFWLLFTFLLAISVVGLFVIGEDWLKIPHKLLECFK